MNDLNLLRQHWQLDPSIAFLNHGSFGACPTVVLEAQRVLQDALEKEPIRFLAPERDLEPKLDVARRVIAGLINAEPDDVAFVRNATDGVNAVLRSFPLQKHDEVVVTNHGYNACNNVARFAAKQADAVVREAAIPFPILDEDLIVGAIEAAFTERTRILLVDHVTSFSGIIFPIERIVEVAHRRGIRVLVDGAHAPGMIPVDLNRIDADYYTANHHKWLCGPKVSGLLYVRREFQNEVRPMVISHAANRSRPNRSRFLAEFDWPGTHDPTTILAVPTAIDFLSRLRPGGLEEYMEANHALAIGSRQLLINMLGIDAPAPASMIGSLVTLPLPYDTNVIAGSCDPLQLRLFDHHKIEVPVFTGPESTKRWIRISCQAYNDLDQYQRLGEVLLSEFKGLRRGLLVE